MVPNAKQDASFFLLAGPCVMEDLKAAYIARHLKRCCVTGDLCVQGNFDKEQTEPPQPLFEGRVWRKDWKYSFNYGKKWDAR